MLNNWVHVRFGQRGVAIIGPLCHIGGWLGLSLHPPYPAFVVIFVLVGFGNGIEDAAWNAFFGSMANANEILGFLHGVYGLGAVLSPLVATNLITEAGWRWYAFYYILVRIPNRLDREQYLPYTQLGGGVLEFVTSAWAFWPVSGRVYRESWPRIVSGKDSRLQESLKSRVTWVVAFFLLCYVGIEVALGGWIVTFMRRERSGETFASGMVATGFWTGIALGRVFLGFLTPKLGEKFAVTVSWLVHPAEDMTLTSATGIHHLRNDKPADFLARTVVQRFGRRSLIPGFLPGSPLPSGRRRSDQSPACAPARVRHWICSSLRWRRCRCAPVRRWRSCPSSRRHDLPAGCPRRLGSLLALVALYSHCYESFAGKPVGRAEVAAMDQFRFRSRGCWKADDSEDQGWDEGKWSKVGVSLGRLTRRAPRADSVTGCPPIHL
jgi:MFS family permease